jgi:N-acetylmuramoyl-L-alanine amidase
MKNIVKGWLIFVLVLVCLFFATAEVEAYDKDGQRYWLAMNMYFEAGNQSDAGRLAVALVTLNRAASYAYPDAIQDVVTQGPVYENWRGNMLPIKHMCQFSWYCDGKADVPEDSETWEEVLQLADYIIQHGIYDITEGATHYHNDTVHPYWADHLTHVVTIDNHLFYK